LSLEARTTPGATGVSPVPNGIVRPRRAMTEMESVPLAQATA